MREDDATRQITGDLAEIKATLRVQADNLAEHMRRTNLAEQRVDALESFVTETRAYMRGAKWLGVVVAGFVAMVAGLAAIIGVIHGW